jgi:phosphoribosylcarboxyaminoimidazole (NCAIR) mutase
VNAALLAVQILALGRPDLRKKMEAHKRRMQKKVMAGDARVQDDLRKMLAGM